MRAGGNWTRDRIDDRVDSLARAHEGDAFVHAVSEFASAELTPEEREVLGRVLLERANEEHDVKQLMRRRAQEHGWLRRTWARLEDLGRGDVKASAESIAAAVAADRPEPERLLAIETELRADRGYAARVLDELSRHPKTEVRTWTVTTTAAVLEDGGVHILMGLTRDRVPHVRDAAVDELVAIAPETARKLVPSLRRRLRSADPSEPVTAMWQLARLRDRESLPAIRRLAEADDLEYPYQRLSAEVAVWVLGDDSGEIARRIREHDHGRMPWLVTAALELDAPELVAALAECAGSAPDEECRGRCRAALAALEPAS